MGWKKIYLAVVVGLVSSFFLMHGRAYSSDAYFTSQEIKEQILHAIEGCTESVDIAVLDITSKDILNALVKAAERGVQVRILAGKKRALAEVPLSNLSKKPGFEIKTLASNGRLHNNFAIFDSRLLITGSYCWNETVGKFNRYNAILTDETRLLVKYQREFDHLFHEGISSSVKEAVSEAEKKGEKGDSKQEVIAANYGVVITGTSGDCINMSYEEFNNIFGIVSDLSDEQKESLWSRCIGKKVTWNGKVRYIGWGLITGWMMSVSYGDTCVEVKLNPAHKEHFSQIKYGNTVTYTGKLDSRVTRIFPYKLEDGDVLEFKNTPPTPLSASELSENPDVVPVSQGPKKIFLVESFDDLDKLFGKESGLSAEQKDTAWGKYRGKYVSWMGRIVSKNVNAATGLRIGIMQKESGDVELKVSLAKKNTVLKFQDGETILYTGKLVERRGGRSPYILEDGDILTVKESVTGLRGM